MAKKLDDSFGTINLPLTPPPASPAKEAAPPPKQPAPVPPASKPAEAAAPKPLAVTEKPAADICRLVALSAEATQLPPRQMNLLPYLYQLMGKALYADGVKLLAHALPKREAVWWACQCARTAAGDSPEPAIAAALLSAEHWAADPNEDHRRAAYAAAEKADFGTPAGCTALGAFLSGGSLGPADVTAIPPDPLLTARMVANAVLLAGVASNPASAPEQYHKFLTQGILLANGVSKLPGKPVPSPAATK